MAAGKKKTKRAAIRGAKIFCRTGKNFKKGTFGSKRYSQQMQIFSVGIMEKIIFKKVNEKQRIFSVGIMEKIIIKKS